jgi:hypothetical protein
LRRVLGTQYTGPLTLSWAEEMIPPDPAIQSPSESSINQSMDSTLPSTTFPSIPIHLLDALPFARSLPVLKKVIGRPPGALGLARGVDESSIPKGLNI